jgi:hypothetical protein
MGLVGNKGCGLIDQLTRSSESLVDGACRKTESFQIRAESQSGVGKDGALSESKDLEIDSGGAQADGQFVAQSGHGCQYAAGSRLCGGMSLV